MLDHESIYINLCKLHVDWDGRQKSARGWGNKILYFLIRLQNREKMHVKIIHVFKLISIPIMY